MLAFIRSLTILAGLCGLMLLCPSCSEDDGAAPSSDVQLARQAEQALLQAIHIESGAVVSFVGPVSPGTSLVNDEITLEYVSITVPNAPGSYYLFFVNDHPDTRYVHAVRYAWLNLLNRHVETVDAQWWPRLQTTPPDTTEFELIAADTLAGVIFYYGRGGGQGFPPTYLDGE